LEREIWCADSKPARSRLTWVRLVNEKDTEGNPD
jgi:hypothetical protein